MTERGSIGLAAASVGSVWNAIARVLQSPRLYDCVQMLAGEHQLRGRIHPYLSSLAAGGRLIDVGGGTGLTGPHVAARKYICLDLDLEKLRRFRSRQPGGCAVAADAAACPVGAASIEGVLCTKVLHHLNDQELGLMLTETVRILKPGGVLVVVDAVRTRRWISRMLWRLDRGSFPRSAAEIRRSLPQEFSVTTWTAFRLGLLHDFVLCAARRAATPNSSQATR